MKKLYRKAAEVLGNTDIVRNRKSWTLHRFMVFFLSARGQKRIYLFAFKVFRYLWRSLFGGRQVDEKVYDKWMQRNFPTTELLVKYKSRIKDFSVKPLISVIMPVFKPDSLYLREAINSLREQIYDHWELCMVDDASYDPELRKFLEKLSKSDHRIKTGFRAENGHIAICSNDCCDLASGTYFSFLDQDDLLSPDALYFVVKAINEHPDAGLIYSDEDKIDAERHFIQPHFKPDFSPHNLLSRNYFGHLVTVKKSVFENAGRFRTGYDGSQDYDLYLRIAEHSNKIVHIPKILYHWRIHEQSTSSNENAKGYAFDNGIKVLEETMKRRGIEATVELIDNSPGFYRIKYKYADEPLVSVIVPTRNQSAVLGVCLNSIFTKTKYQNFEVIVVNNNSSEEALFEMLNRWKQREKNRFHTVNADIEFNFSKLINLGVNESNGTYVLFLNNDTEVIGPDWMHVMVSHARQDDVGAVGVKLLYPNNTVQHGGVIIGIGGVAGHTFVAADAEDPGYFYYLKTVSDYSAVTAACMMVSREKFDEVGGFDEALAIEYNDVDFCLKLTKKGYYNLFVPDVQLYHYESLTRGHPHANRRVYKRHLKEVKYFKKRWQHVIDNDPHYNPNLTRLTTYFEPNVNG